MALIARQFNHEVGLLGEGGEARIASPSEAYVMSLRSPRSRVVMSSYLNKIAKMFGYKSHMDADWALFDRKQAQVVMEHLSVDGLTPNTSRVYLAAIKGVIREAWLLGMVDAEHFERIKQVKPNRGERIPKGRRLADSEVKKLIKSCQDKTIKGARDAALLSLLVECGLRRSEVVSIKMEDIDLEHGVVKLIGKGNKERLAFLPKLSKKNIQAWLEYRGEQSGYLFNRIWKGDSLSDNGLTGQAVLVIIEKRSLDAGIKKFAPHDMRRTFATKLFEMGVDPLTIQKAMGHANLATTQGYDMRGSEAVREMAKNFSYT